MPIKSVLRHRCVDVTWLSYYTGLCIGKLGITMHISEMQLTAVYIEVGR